MKRSFAWRLGAMMLLCIALAAPLLAGNANLDKAVQAARQGDWDEVAVAAQAAVSEDPGNAAAWSLLADAQMNLGDTTAAVTDYQKALSADAKYPGAVFGLTRHYLRQNQIEAADKVVAAAEEKDKKGKSDEIKVARGMVMARQGNFAQARTIIASATEKNPTNALYPWILARIYNDQDVLDLAEENYAKAWKLDPGNPTLAYEYGLVLQDQKKYNEALDLFKTVQEKDPSNKTVDYLIGRLYFAAKRYAEAAQQFEKAVAKRPDHFLSNVLAGRSYVELSKAEKKNFYPRAIPYLRKAMSLRPDRADARQYLADALVNQSKTMVALAATDSAKGSAVAYYDSSIAMAREALALDSAIEDAHGQMARAFDKKGMLDSAAVHAEMEVRRQPADRNELTRLVNIYQRQKRQGEIVRLLEPMNVMSDTALVRKFGLILVNAYSETNDFAKARDLAQQIIAADPGNCQAHATYAYIVVKRERWSEAVSVLRNGVKSCPNDGDMWLLLGDSYYFSIPKGQKDKGALENARDAYGHACKLGSKDGCQKREQIEQLLAQR